MQCLDVLVHLHFLSESKRRPYSKQVSGQFVAWNRALEQPRHPLILDQIVARFLAKRFPAVDGHAHVIVKNIQKIKIRVQSPVVQAVVERDDLFEVKMTITDAVTLNHRKTVLPQTHVL